MHVIRVTDPVVHTQSRTVSMRLEFSNNLERRVTFSPAAFDALPDICRNIGFGESLNEALAKMGRLDEFGG